MKWTAHIINFLEKLKNFHEWPGNGPLKKKTFEHNYLAFLKVVPGTFWAWVQKQKNKIRFSEDLIGFKNKKQI